MFKKEIVNLLKQTFSKRFKLPEIEVFYTENKEFGDYSTNLAFKIASQSKKIPFETAEFLASLLKAPFLSKVEAKKPGFINFFLTPQALQTKLSQLGDRVAKLGGIGGKEKISVEFISANPTGELHIGHGRSAFYGDVLANILEFVGHKVEREYYINDAKNSNQIIELGKTALGEGESYLTNYTKSKISPAKIFQKKNLGGQENFSEAGYLLAKEIQKDNKKFIIKNLKIKFDHWFNEESLYQQNKIKKVLNLLKNKNLVYEKEGAIWLEDSVLVRSTGEPTYFLSDIAYHQDKFQRRYNNVINIWGADHQGHVKRIKAAAKILNYKGNFEILISQLVTLKGEKLSKRKGKIITLKQLIEEIGLDAARFFYLLKSLDTQMEFDLDLAREQSKKNPVYYVQYANARINSILAKSNLRRFNLHNIKRLNLPEELDLMRELIKFPEVIEEIAESYQVHHLPQYAMKLADKFHRFYEEARVLTPDKELTSARLGLVIITQKILKQVLDLMGISAPKKM